MVLAEAFQLWEFRVSHGQLLLRSPGTPIRPKNIDLIFVGVLYVELPVRMMTGLEVVQANQRDLEAATVRYGAVLRNEDVWVLIVGKRRHLVVATGYRVEENELGMFESSLERF